MSVETVLSIVESASGDSLVTEFLEMTAAEAQAYLRARHLEMMAKQLPEMTAAWVNRLRYLRSMRALTYVEQLAASNAGDAAFETAMSQVMAEEAAVAQAATIAEANAAAVAAEGTLVAGAGTTVAAVVLPVIALVAVGVALGAPYYQARQEAKKKGYSSGFSKGFITGLLDWELRFTIDRFWDNAVDKNPYDEAIPVIRANAHNSGLVKGRLAGMAKTPAEKKQYLKGLRMIAHPSKAGWLPRNDNWAERMRARQVQISYVIEMATTAVGRRLIKEE